VRHTEIMTTTSRAAGPAAAVIGGQRLELLDRARVYACGITPYDVTHLGHAATFVWVDALARILSFAGVEPEVCRNVTDVDDVLDAAARRAGVPYDTFAAVQQFQFDQDMAALRVRPPEHEPRAHRYVGQVIRLALGLLDAGAAYLSRGGVFFRGGQVAARAGLDRAAALARAAEFGGRPEDPAKADPLDVAVWQASEPGHPAWQSPWGPGRPGWHAECAAMAMSVFGPAVDIHAGGADLRFPHHAYHAAMAEAFTGVRPYARAWFHVGTVTVDGAKMAKSSGNLVLLDKLLASHPPAVVRMMILDRRFGASWDYRPALAEAAAARLEALYAAAGRPGRGSEEAALGELRRLLTGNLEIPAALDVATEAGGAAARTLASVLAVS
jgi:cysteinyl-tRNA synthetase